MNLGYAGSILNTITFEKSVMSEIVCHDLAKLKDHLLFSEASRLVSKGIPTKAFKSMVMQAFGLDTGATIYSCSKAHMQPAGVCTKGDVAFLQKQPGEQLQVCNVWMHVEVNNIVYSLVSMWRVIEICELGWFAIVKKSKDAEFIETRTLACCSSYMSYEEDTFRVLVPLQMR